jgi:signal transduction histidine kinase
MRGRTARAMSWAMVVAALALSASTIVLNVVGSGRSPGVVIVGDAGVPSMQEGLAELQRLMVEGNTLLAPAFSWGSVLFYALMVGWTATGALILARQPSNVAGWIFSAVGLAILLDALAVALTVQGVKVASGSVPLLGLWALVGEYSLLVVALVPLLFLLYPDGRPPSKRWRWAMWALFGGLALGMTGSVLTPGPLNNFFDAGILYQNPVGIEAAGAIFSAITAIGAAIGILAGLACIVALVLRFRRSTGEERQKLRWLAFVGGLAGSLFVLLFLSSFALEALVGEGELAIFDYFFGAVLVTLVVGIPAAYFIAIFRYGLWNLDVVLKKTVLYVILVGLMVALGVLVAVTALGTLLWRSDNPYVPVGLGILIGLLFFPLRRVSTAVADRVVYGRRATPYQVLTAFSDQVGGTYSTEDVLPRMAQILGRAVGADLARVWLRLGNQLVPEGSWPGDPAIRAIPLQAQSMPTMEGEDAFEVRHHGELLGALSVRLPANDPMNESKERLIRGLASQAGLVLRNVRLIEDLRSSRRRLVQAQDEERRRLERNLHDGAQQQLVALSVQLGLAEGLVERDAPAAKRTLAGLRQHVSETLDDLRDLARGIYPPVLMDQGLPAAIAAQARKAPLPVELRAEAVGRYSQDAEAAVYFSILEALQNVAKYAGASKATVRLWNEGEALYFAVSDDGVGFDPEQTSYGTGLQGMMDRLEALGGSLDVESRVGAGTTIRGRIPAGPPPQAQVASPTPAQERTAVSG